MSTQQPTRSSAPDTTAGSVNETGVTQVAHKREPAFTGYGPASISVRGVSANVAKGEVTINETGGTTYTLPQGPPDQTENVIVAQAACTVVCAAGDEINDLSNTNVTSVALAAGSAIRLSYTSGNAQFGTWYVSSASGASTTSELVIGEAITGAVGSSLLVSDGSETLREGPLTARW